jgi:hypothetical protein
MAKIFISHSQHDTEINLFFSQIFNQTKVEPVYEEFEQDYAPPGWMKIRKDLWESKCAFLTFGSQCRNSPYTEHWIAFETGLACGWGKRVWVFEKFDELIDFPLPYFTDYMMCDTAPRGEWFSFIKAIIESYDDTLVPLIPCVPPLGISLGFRPSQQAKSLQQPPGHKVECPNPDCRFFFRVHNRGGIDLKCPGCQQWSHLPDF